MRIFLAPLLLVALSACNGKAIDFGGTAYAASIPNIRFSGSCLIQTATRAPLLCQDFWNRENSELESAVRTQCTISGAIWSSTACSSEGREGGCRSKTDEAGAYVVQWFYLAAAAKEAREVCPRDGSSTWM